MKKFQFEVCANSVESCLAAQAGGANRVELCAGIPEGGTTPSYGEISTAREMLTTTRLHVIIRPRGGDFLYSPIEVKTMLKDIEMARQLGADGVVFGCLTANGEIDLPVMQELMKASQGLSVTFHRAFDVCCNPEKALEQINTEYYIHTFCNEYEAFANWRRTGYPKLTPSQNAASYPNNVTNGEIPRRFIYPTSEITANPVNYNDAVKRLSGGDKMTSRVWWDK